MVQSAYLCPALEHRPVLQYNTGSSMGMEGAGMEDKGGITDILYSSAQRRKRNKTILRRQTD